MNWWCLWWWLYQISMTSNDSKPERISAVDMQRSIHGVGWLPLLPASVADASSIISATTASHSFSLLAGLAWKSGITGENVHVAVFDTGISNDQSILKSDSEVDKLNWAMDGQLMDSVGHGTFVAGISKL
jgi:subtilisin family serine protease